MMPRTHDQLLLPVSPWFMWASLLVALLLNLLPLGRAPVVPDILALALVFWTVHQPRRVGVGISFLFGLVMDVHAGALLGQHALAYTLLSFFAIALHRRLLWFTAPAQALHVLPLFMAGTLVGLLVRLAAGDAFPGWSIFAAPLLQTLLWAPVSLLLLAPQRRAPDRDANRPL
ncbi:MAG: rod shape-determining protein MreD [Leptothrix sp. (in: Bacteria)]|jgi:rod shape-determining protein MreD|nr:rod shape-determining protein MreD [Leptothrix sp. (in: b-proteobacteria)]MBP7521206.1 rod shape-determining protein MreD [Leptothrix sp. (in: b-proteobacteria)]